MRSSYVTDVMNGAEPNEPLDLEGLDIGPMLRHARTATFAPNWKSVLLADGAVGVVVIVLGVLLTRWISWVGWPVVAVGLLYVFLVVRRALQWRWLRDKAGLS